MCIVRRHRRDTPKQIAVQLQACQGQRFHLSGQDTSGVKRVKGLFSKTKQRP